MEMFKMIIYTISNDTALIVNNKQNDFMHNINRVVEISGLLIVHIFDSIEKKGSIKMSEQPVNGIYAINASGDIEWNIKDIIHNDDMYTGILADENGNLVVNTFSGIAKIIDVKTKKIIGKRVTK